uniref:Conotoxin superfamily O3 n=1 Tax=Conus magus TaxID=6492 RepID=A0A679PIY1_CONMA|nr:TPA_inf: conotoxin superfamily O3 [Conus magus]
MSGLRIMVLTLLLLVSMATSHHYAREKQATQRDAINVIRRRSVIRRQVTEACEEVCEKSDKHCCDVIGGTACATRCLG